MLDFPFLFLNLASVSRAEEFNLLALSLMRHAASTGYFLGLVLFLVCVIFLSIAKVLLVAPFNTHVFYFTFAYFVVKCTFECYPSFACECKVLKDKG